MKDLKKLKIAYIGGGSRGWARTLMNDLANDAQIGGTVNLYDIDYQAAKGNETIGNRLSARKDVAGKWKYVAKEKLDDALKGSDFVVLSILPGTFDEMASDVHTPEKYGIWQSVGDTVGPGGVMRALRLLPMYVEFANAIKRCCPQAWVINFTNPMTMCVRTLYKVFPKIKAFGCCHEVFGTQGMLAEMVEKKLGVKADREEIKLNVLGINHFTWVDRANYRGVDLFPVLKEYIKEHPDGIDLPDLNWANKAFLCRHKVKFELFERYGILAAAGDRHLAEFCPGSWYLKNPETVEKYGFSLTTVDWRKEDLALRLKKTKELIDGKEFELVTSGEESVRQIKALLGIGEFVTNVNLPNVGQMPGLPLGAVVETNAYFSGDSVQPLFAGSLPEPVHALVERVVLEQETVVGAALESDYEKAFTAFINDANVGLPIDTARKLYDEMLENTKAYLPAYENYILSRKGKLA